MRKNENGKTETDSGAEPLGLNEKSGCVAQREGRGEGKGKHSAMASSLRKWKVTMP